MSKVHCLITDLIKLDSNFRLSFPEPHLRYKKLVPYTNLKLGPHYITLLLLKPYSTAQKKTAYQLP
jgi:hypothetical protein